ncbi:MAG: SUMF1/EgtB/PvdO family nonheme iron enzyme [Anaerolineales bacterium]|nr:SUMF1/EgtB/PvdO family nonheme iron enzyme [Anaerolineales bacterium]
MLGSKKAAIDFDEQPLPSATLQIRIPAGEFIMGTSNQQIQSLLRTEEWANEWIEKDLFKIEQPQHIIALPAYSIARTPVINHEYQEFILDTNHRVPRHWMGFSFPEETENHPVTEVSLADALAFCSWLSKKTGSTFRLPTEAEWERAARGDDGRMYPWGNEFDPWRCNTKERGKSGATPILSYSPGGDSPWGAADMSGNVMEWTHSTMQPYPFKQIPPQSGKEECVVRGGSWYYSRRLARCSSRETVLSTLTSPALGFRVVQTD